MSALTPGDSSLLSSPSQRTQGAHNLVAFSQTSTQQGNTGDQRDTDLLENRSDDDDGDEEIEEDDESGEEGDAEKEVENGEQKELEGEDEEEAGAGDGDQGFLVPDEVGATEPNGAPSTSHSPANRAEGHPEDYVEDDPEESLTADQSKIHKIIEPMMKDIRGAGFKPLDTPTRARKAARELNTVGVWDQLKSLSRDDLRAPQGDIDLHFETATAVYQRLNVDVEGRDSHNFLPRTIEVLLALRRAALGETVDGQLQLARESIDDLSEAVQHVSDEQENQDNKLTKIIGLLQKHLGGPTAGHEGAENAQSEDEQLLEGEVEAEPPQQVDCDEEDEEGSDAGRADDDETARCSKKSKTCPENGGITDCSGGCGKWVHDKCIRYSPPWTCKPCRKVLREKERLTLEGGRRLRPRPAQVSGQKTGSAHSKPAASAGRKPKQAKKQAPPSKKPSVPSKKRTNAAANEAEEVEDGDAVSGRNGPPRKKQKSSEAASTAPTRKKTPASTSKKRQHVDIPDDSDEDGADAEEVRPRKKTRVANK